MRKKKTLDCVDVCTDTVFASLPHALLERLTGPDSTTVCLPEMRHALMQSLLLDDAGMDLDKLDAMSCTNADAPADIHSLRHRRHARKDGPTIT